MDYIFKKILKIQNNEEDQSKNKKILQYGMQEKYEGQVTKNNVRHGQGSMNYSNGERYEGEWFYDLRQGQGKQFYNNGELYRGQWNKDKKEGTGKYFYNNNERYEGDWLNDLRHGQGSYFYRNGDVYVGQWVKGKKEGKGVITYYNNEKYDGEWLNDKKHIKTQQNNEGIQKEGYKLKKGDKRDDDKSDSNSDEENDDQMRKKESPTSNPKKDNSPNDKKNGQQFKDFKYNEDDIKPESQFTENNDKIDKYGHNQNISDDQEKQHIYTNLDTNNHDNNDFVIATNVETSQDIKSNQIATEIVDTNDNYRTNGQISIDDSKAIDILETMESYEILNNFPQDLREWTTEDICKWLSSIGLGEYSHSFESNQICGQSICMLSEQELEQSIGIRALGKRKIFLKYQEMLKKYYNKKLSKEAKNFIQKHQNRLRKGEKQLSFLKQSLNNYRSIREEDESASSAKNSLNSNQINHIEDNFMLLEEEDEEDDSNNKNEVKKQKEKEKNNNNYRKNSESDSKENNEKEKKILKKQKKKKRDQGGNETSSLELSDFSEKEQGIKNQQQRSRENTGSITSKEDIQNHKEKQRARKNSISDLKKNETDECNRKEFKDNNKHFADDEDEDKHKLLKISKKKTTNDTNKNQTNNLTKAVSENMSTHQKIKSVLNNNVFCEDKFLAESKGEKKVQSANYFDKRNSKNDGNSSPIVEQDLQQQLSKGFSQLNKTESKDFDAQSNSISQNNNTTANEQIQKQLPNQIEQKDIYQLKSSPNKHRQQSDNIICKDQIYNSNPSEETTEQKLAKSFDNGSSQYLNSPDVKSFNTDLRSLQPDFVNTRPYILNFNISLNQTCSSNNTLYKLGISKDMQLNEKNDSQKSGLTKVLSGQTQANQSSGAAGNPITQSSSIDNNQGVNKANQNSNNAASINQIVSSSSSSDESSENEQNKVQFVRKRSKGDGGESPQSLDSDNNSKIKQKCTPQQKFKKEISTKDGSRHPSKDKVNLTPQIKHKQKQKDVSVEKLKLRREHREQQLDQLLRDMGINKKLIINYSELDFGKKIGEGSYGQVFKGAWQKTQVAIKQFGKQNSKFHLRKVQDFISEVRVINNLRHPNIVLYMGVCLYQSQYFMITEYLQEGSLFDHLHDKKTVFSESKQIDMIEDMALGMVYLHGRKVMHCDLKSSNVLIDENWNVKLCDFGLSRIKSTLNKKKDERKTEGLVGTPQWMAPEIMRREQYQEHSDVYSFGMIMWEFATRQIPYRGLSHSQIYGTVGYDDKYQVEMPKRGIPRYLNLMKKCLKRNPEERPIFQEIVEEIQLIKKDLKDNNKKQVVKEIIRFFD